MMRLLSLLLALVLLCLAPLALAQTDCPALVEAALHTASAACADLGRNQACYGNVLLQATPRGDVPTFTFEQTGDIVNIADIDTLQLSSMSLSDGTWGVGLMKLQANLPDTVPGQNVTLLLFGDVQLTNAVEPVVELPMRATGNVNVRLRPRTDQDNIMASLTRGQEVVANGRLADSTWIRIEVEGDARGVGWVSVDFLTSDGDINSLNIVQPGAAQFGPMQAFYFSSGLGDAPCAEAPESGILLQTPQGAGQILLDVNGASIQLGSTVFAQTGDGFMWLSVLEGGISVSASGVTQAVPAGTFTRVPLGADGLVNGAPEFPQPYDQSKFAALPLVLLPEQIVVATPIDPESIQTAVQAAQAEASGEFFPLEGVYTQHWTFTGGETFNTAQITIITPGESFSWVVLGGNPNPTVFTRTGPSVYTGRIYVFTFTSDTTFIGTATDPTGAIINITAELVP
ncbi:MAG: hypothetical protein HXY40_18945 [Chloroflexi bacterium]|nr:hypothetical protein [Chloroflexota bacterium]